MRERGAQRGSRRSGTRRSVSPARHDTIVTTELVFADLFAFAQGSLAWVRVYRRRDRRTIVLVVEPIDNPGRSSVNAAEELLADLHRAFGEPGELRVFVSFVDDRRGPDWTELVA